jgi:Ca2+:H+ antiporter
MLPAANMLGFAGQELSRKMPQKAIAVVLETTFGSVVEIVLFMVLLKQSVGDSNIFVIQAAILGSILANLLLCLGTCFIAGGLKHDTQEFHEAVSESGSGLMLVAASALSPAIPVTHFADFCSGSRASRRFQQVPLQQRRLCR